jgi:hypothetical protein
LIRVRGEFHPGQSRLSAQSATGLFVGAATGVHRVKCAGAGLGIADNPERFRRRARQIRIAAATTSHRLRCSTRLPRAEAWRGSFGSAPNQHVDAGTRSELGTGLGHRATPIRNLGTSSSAGQRGTRVFVPAHLIDPNSGCSHSPDRERHRSAGCCCSIPGWHRAPDRHVLGQWITRRHFAAGGPGPGPVVGRRAGRSGGFAGVTAGLNPASGMGRSDFERRHSIWAVTWPATAALEITGIARLTAARPTPTTATSTETGLTTARSSTIRQ